MLCDAFLMLYAPSTDVHHILPQIMMMVHAEMQHTTNAPITMTAISSSERLFATGSEGEKGNMEL